MDDRGETEWLTVYARSLGIAMAQWEDGTPVVQVQFGQTVEGRAEHFHGGAIGALLEAAGYATLREALAEAERQVVLKPINITVQYLSVGKSRTSYAKARVTKLGKRSANLTVEAWQDDRSRPIATAVMNVFMAQADD